jgi:predicted small secreted protein
MLKKIAAVIAFIGIAAGLVACNTVEGVGKDVKATGSTVEKAAEKSKPY